MRSRDGMFHEDRPRPSSLSCNRRASSS
jgi:hypothetical protein